MERVSKVFFDPLLSERSKAIALLLTLPVGSAHPFNGELLVHSQKGNVTTVDISQHPEDYFSNAVSLADLGEDVLARMQLYPSMIGEFNSSYAIQQVPSATFKIPIVAGKIHIFALSKREPTYYDLCVADSKFNTSCFIAKNTFSGLAHSGDNEKGLFLLQYLTFDLELDDEARTVFVSGYDHQMLSKFKASNPLVLIANHTDKVLYIVPVPLDTATIGNAILCCPLVIKKDPSDDSLICAILPTPATDDNLMCTGPTLKSPSFKTAIDRADLTLSIPSASIVQENVSISVQDKYVPDSNSDLKYGKDVFIASPSADLSGFTTKDKHVIRFGKGIEWISDEAVLPEDHSLSVLPCVLGGMLEGPLLLAIGQTPSHLPFKTTKELHRYYEQAKSVVVVVDEKMTDNARNLATPWRLNGLFIVQKPGEIMTDNPDLSALNDANINSVTALGGPQSLVLVQLGEKYYYYRGIADPKYLDTSQLKFGQEITEIINNIDTHNLMNSKWPRIANLSRENHIYLVKSNKELQLKELKDIFKNSTIAELQHYKDDIIMAIPQLQALLAQEKLQDFCSSSLILVHDKLAKAVGPVRKDYARFVTQKYDSSDAESRKKKDKMLASFKKLSKEASASISWLTQTLGNVVSSQTSSTRTHDIKRLLRQNTIKNNVDAAKSMTFEKMGELLEEYAEEMGVLVTNINTEGYKQYLEQSLHPQTTLSSIENTHAALTARDICNLDTRTLYLEGLDAGLVLEQSQNEHNGPLASQHGHQQPILAMPYLNNNVGSGSVLVWVCWDEFVNLGNPYIIRWMEKCNDPHIAALRILMRGTLTNAISSRDLDTTFSSVATGQLMGSLLMAAMSKLAATRQTPSTTIVKAEDTSMKLMRGLFGHLLTIAGSGTQPLSFVWQLFGTLPQLDIPNSQSDWIWYENTVRLFPYTGWEASKFKKNLSNFLDKLIFRMMTKNEQNDSAARLKSFEDFCKIRNIQLLHSRLIITVLKEMLTEQNDCQKAAKRLLEVIPETVENDTGSYFRLRMYVDHLSHGGKQRAHDNLLAANFYTRRSAVFANAKRVLSKAVKDSDNLKTIELCRLIIDQRAKIEGNWSLQPNTVKVQNIKNIQKILDTLLAGKPLEQDMKARALSDHEQKRKAWLVGASENESIEPLDRDLINHILNGNSATGSHQREKLEVVVPTKKEGFELYQKYYQPGFLEEVEAASNVKEVCNLLCITEGALVAFQQMLAPDFKLEALPDSFKEVVLSLLKDRNREKAEPTKMLFAVPSIEK